ncbi:MAG: tRNA epoxyqueuosine(34) reductase QueG [Oligoflexia bacterium]
MSLGFAEAAGVDWALAREEYARHSARYEEWLQRGFAGEMNYLVRGLDRRKNPELVFSGLKSVFCVLLPYRQSPLGHTDPSLGPRYARYLDGPDYHDRISQLLLRTLESVKQDSQFSELKWKICIDTSAVLERTWASLSGLGWIGKNTLLIHPQWGSRFFIGVAFLNQNLGVGIQKHPDYCGRCTACLKSCPTGAIVSPGWLDSRNCISYWTLEKRGHLDLSAEQKRAIGNWVAGCDLCQDSCPFNRKPEKNLPDPELPQGNSRYSATWQQLEMESDDAYRLRVQGSALSRIKPEMARRNFKLARANCPPNQDLPKVDQDPRS